MKENQLFKKIEEIESQRLELYDQINEHKSQIEIIKKQIEDLKLELIEQGKPIIRYSTFFNHSIGPALAELITTIDGREFIYSKVRAWEYDSGIEYKNVVVDKTKYQDSYKFDELNELVREGDAICIYETNSILDKEPNFFEKHGCFTYLNVDAIRYEHKKFPYIEDFFETLVQSCYDQDYRYPSESFINNCLKDFLDNYKIEHETKNQTLIKKYKTK